MTYVLGYGVALLLTCTAFALVYLHLLGGRQALYTVLGLGLAEMAVQWCISAASCMSISSVPPGQI